LIDLFKGIRWLIENGLIQNTPEHTAAFLFNETGLSKRAIGDYLGEKYEHTFLLTNFIFYY
jgi:Sec7-like guanine-nucleotide exchange factor